MATTLTYLGGIPEFKKSCDVTVKVTPINVWVSAGVLTKAAIPYEDITNVSMKTDEQITKDVTITRLLLIGVFAFGAKKKSKHTNYNLVIDYKYGDLQTSAIFSGDGVPEVNSEIMKRRTAFLKKNPPPVDTPTVPMSIAEQPTDTAVEIAKFKMLLDSGAITQDEYDAKKKQLLGL